MTPAPVGVECLVYTVCRIAGRPGIFYPHACEEAARDPVFLPVLQVGSSRHDASNSFRQFGSFVGLRTLGFLPFSLIPWKELQDN